MRNKPMVIYTSPTGFREREFCKEHKLGWMISADHWRSPDIDMCWALDNGAWSYFNRNERFNEHKFLCALKKIPENHPPDFIIVPDVVCGGLGSLLFSNNWFDRIGALPFNYYLSVQDGIEPIDLGKWVENYNGIFVGGTKEWKLKTMKEWTDYAHSIGLKCHVGRISSLKHILQCDTIEVDSIDSTTIVRKPEKLSRIIAFNKQSKLKIEIA